MTSRRRAVNKIARQTRRGGHLCGPSTVVHDVLCCTQSRRQQAHLSPDIFESSYRRSVDLLGLDCDSGVQWNSFNGNPTLNDPDRLNPSFSLSFGNALLDSRLPYVYGFLGSSSTSPYLQLSCCKRLSTISLVSG